MTDRLYAEDLAPRWGVRKLRVFLERAGVKRAELFAEDDETRKPITFAKLD